MKKILAALMILIIVLLNVPGCKQSEVKNEPTESSAPETLPPDPDLFKPVDMNKMKSLIDNSSSYEKLSGKIYSYDDIRPFYIPYRVKNMFQRKFTFDDINNLLQIRFLREHELGYYTYFDLENARFFVFFDQGGIMSAMFNYPLNPISIKDFNKLKKGQSTLEDVMNIDKSTFVYDAVAEIINKDKTPREEPISEHLVSEGQLLEIVYKRKDDSLIVSNIRINNDFLAAVDKDPYFDNIYTIYP